MARLISANSRTLGAFSIWAIGVGLVISGESFGWNNGWRHMGVSGFMIPVLLVSILYIALVRCNVELACVYPEAEGPHSYAAISLGRDFSRFVAFATLVEFLFASPAIANTIGEYIAYLSPDLFEARWIATGFLVLFCVVNLFRIQVSTLFVIFLTVLAIIELSIYFYAVAPKYESFNLSVMPYDDYRFSSLIKAMPFAIWLYLGIEGISLVTKNVKAANFKRHISVGYYASLATLGVLIFLVLILAGGSTAWVRDIWNQMVSESNGHPLPTSMALALGRENSLVQVFTFLGLFGLIASLQGIVLASMKQIQSLLPQSRNNILSSLIVLAVGLGSIWLKTTAFLIELSVFGAVCMYLSTGLSLLVLRSRKAPSQELQTAEIIYNHSDFSSWLTYSSAIVVIVLSVFCTSSLTIVHTDYLLYFLLLAAVFVIAPKFYPNKTIR